MKYFIWLTLAQAITIDSLNQKQYFSDIPIGIVDLKVKTSILSPNRVYTWQIFQNDAESTSFEMAEEFEYKPTQDEYLEFDFVVTKTSEICLPY